MDHPGYVRIDDVRTFLEITACGSFSAAAKRLHVTQSTVSARVRALEQELDRPLFQRGRGGAVRTVAGIQFQRYAVHMVQAWQQARQEVALPSGFRTSLGLGVQVSLWQWLMPQWIPWMRKRCPEVALRIEVQYSDVQMEYLASGLLDMGVLYGPRPVPGLEVETLFEEKLIMVSTRRRRLASGWPKDYVYVNWGELFRAQHSEAFPSVGASPITFGLGEVALRHVLEQGGTSYFPIRRVHPLIAERALFAVKDAPSFLRPAYLIYRTSAAEDEIQRRALQGMRRIARRSVDADSVLEEKP